MITLYSTHFSIIDILKELSLSVAKIKDDVTFKLACTSLEYASASVEKDIQSVDKLNDVKFLEFVKNIDLDSMYDKIIEDRDRVDAYCDEIKDFNETRYIKLHKLADKLLDSYIGLEMAYSRLEDLIIEDKYKRAS